MVALVDRSFLPQLHKYHWRAVKSARLWYAKTTIGAGKKAFDLSMHRLIAHTPRGQVCHHINYNSLDNRLCNLINMAKIAHSLHHKQNNIIIKFEQMNPEKPADTHKPPPPATG